MDNKPIYQSFFTAEWVSHILGLLFAPYSVGEGALLLFFFLDSK